MERQLIKQSDSVTFGKFRMTSWQVNCLVNIVDKLQDKIDLNIDWGQSEVEIFKKYFSLNDYLEFKIEVPLKDVDPHEHYGQLRKDIRKLMGVPVEYTYISEKGVETYAFLTLFPRVEIPIGRGIAEFYLTIHSLKWILQYGQKTQLTTFDKRSVLALRGVYAKRIFQILSSYYKQRIFRMKIEDLSQILCTPKYSVQDFERKVLQTAQMEMINNENSRLFFKYKLVTTEKKKSAGRPKRDTVIFKIYDTLTAGSVEEFKTDNFENE